MQRTFRVLGVTHVGVRPETRLRRANLRVISVSLDMLLQVLRTLEGLATEVALVRLQGDMDTNVRRDVVALDRGGTAGTPLTSQVQVVGALAADMALTHVFL